MSATAGALYTGRIFPGLRPFEEEDALLFFGRERQTDELLRRLDDTRFLAVVGLSGSGKSSLVRAGLLPALRRGHLSGAGPCWRSAVMRPGSDPVGMLAQVLNETLGEREERRELLRSGRLGLLDASRQGRNPDENLLVVVDQFEEIFRFQREYRERTEEAAEFVELLLAAAEEYEPQYRVYVVITMRSDYLGECARFAPLPEALNESQYLVPRMTREQLREAIEGPAALGGVKVAPDLLEELLEMTGDDPDQLPILQHLLMRMWESRNESATGSRITRDEYIAVGGWDNALNKHAEEVLEDLKKKLRGNGEALAKRIFQRLTDKGEASREGRRPAKLRELAAVAEALEREQEIRAVVDHFRKEGCNFLTSSDRDLTGESMVDISHESLIRRWNTLRKWVDEEARSAEWYQRVEGGKRIYDRGEGGHLVDPELQSALQERERGRWNGAWAERYAAKRDDVNLAYDEVIRFLEESRARNVLGRLRRARAIMAAAAVLFAALATVAGYFWWSASQLEHLVRAQFLAGEAERQQNRIGAGELAALLAAQSFTMNKNHQGDGIAEIDRVMRSILNRPYFVRNLSQAKPPPIDAMALSADGKRLALVKRGQLVFWQQEHERKTKLPLETSLRVLALNPAAKSLAGGAADGSIWLWDWDSEAEAPRRLNNLGQSITALSFNPAGTLLAALTEDADIHLVDAAVSGPEVPLAGHQKKVTAVAFSRDGNSIVSGDASGLLRIWTHQPGRPRMPWLSGPPITLPDVHDVTALVFSPDATRIAVATSTGQVRVVSREGRVDQTYTLDVNIRCIDFDGERLLVGTVKPGRIFILEDGKLHSKLDGHEEAVLFVRFAEDGGFYSGSTDLPLREWIRLPPEPDHLDAPKGYVESAAFSADGTVLAIGADQISILRQSEPAYDLPGKQLGVSAMAFDRDAKTLVSGSLDKTIRLWDLSRKAARLSSLEGTGHQKTVTAIALHPTGQTIFSAGYDGLREWAVLDPGSGTVLRERPKREGTFETLALSRDGTYLAASGVFGPSRDDALGKPEVCVWKTGARDSPPECREGAGVTAATFSRAEKALLATGSEDGTILLRDGAGMSTKQTLLAEGKVTTLAFNHDDTMLAAGLYSGSIQMWDLRRPASPPIVLRGPSFKVLAVAFRQVDNKLISVSSDGSVVAWSLSDVLYNRICQFAARPLTSQEWDHFLPGYSRNHASACQEEVATGGR